MPVRTPSQILEAASAAGQNKAAATSRRGFSRLMTGSILAGAYIALGGALSIAVGYGFPEAASANPGLQRFMSGLVFPIGLMLVVVLGADLFTGNNAVLMPAALQGKISPWAAVRNWVAVYLGNFMGVLLFTMLFVYAVGLTAAEPYHSAVQRIAEAKVAMPWHVVLLKGIGANWFVCLAVWLAASAKTMLAKMAGCWLPVMAFVALGYEHSIANMFFIPIGMLEGADVTLHQFFIANLLPATIGNIIGGALLVGTAYTYVNRSK